MKISIIIETLLFSSALGFKTRKHEIDKSQAEKTLLENQITTQQKESKLQLLIAEAEQKALKAQMNPHFMFNCLNTFKYLIQENENDKAEEYLVKFAELIRAVVDYSQEPKIPLSKELEICELYLEMESLRFGNAFQTNFEISDAMDTSFIQVPPFLLQPILENAIWHGLSQKEGSKDLKISVFEKGDIVICSVRDNGIGREKAKANLLRNRVIAKKSVGLKNAMERLALFKELYDIEILLDIIDRKDEQGNPTGTQVNISIPQ